SPHGSTRGGNGRCFARGAEPRCWKKADTGKFGGSAANRRRSRSVGMASAGLPAPAGKLSVPRRRTIRLLGIGREGLARRQRSLRRSAAHHGAGASPGKIFYRARPSNAFFSGSVAALAKDKFAGRRHTR